MSRETIELPGGARLNVTLTGVFISGPMFENSHVIMGMTPAEARAFAAAMNGPSKEALAAEIVEAVYGHEDAHAAVLELLER